MIIKSPVVYDVSHWKIIPDFSKVSPRPVLVFTKATEAYPGTPFNSIVDKTFAPYFIDMQSAGIPRGAYHFHRKNYNSLEQAKHFVYTVKPYLTPVDILALDLEEGGESAAQIIQWLDYVQGALPNLIMIYSAKIILDPIPMTEAQKTRLKQFPIWTAGYPWFPDLFNTVPSGYVPDPSKWGPVWLWQYSSHGKVEGISGDVDCNWISPVFYEMIKNLGSEPTPDPEPTPEPDPTEDPMPILFGEVIVTELNIRPTASTAQASLGKLKQYDLIEASEEVSGWWKLTSIKRGSQQIPLPASVCWAYEGLTNGYIRDLSGPTPDPTPAPGLPAYFTAYDAAGNALGRYDKQ